MNENREERIITAAEVKEVVEAFKARHLLYLKQSGAMERISERFRAALYFKIRRKVSAALKPDDTRETALELARLHSVKLLQLMAIESMIHGSRMTNHMDVINEAIENEDTDFLLALSQVRGRTIDTLLSFDGLETSILMLWDGFEIQGVSSSHLPGLKHWSDDSAHKYLSVMHSNANLTYTSYVQKRTRLGLRLEKPTLIKNLRVLWGADGNTEIIGLPEF